MLAIYKKNPKEILKSQDGQSALESGKKLSNLKIWGRNFKKVFWAIWRIGNHGEPISLLYLTIHLLEYSNLPEVTKQNIMVRVDFEKKDQILNQVKNLCELLLKMEDKDQDSICYWIYQNRGWRHEKDHANDPEAEIEDGGSKGRCDEKTERERERGSKILGKKDKEALTLDGGEDPRWKEEDDLHQKEVIIEETNTKMIEQIRYTPAKSS